MQADNSDDYKEISKILKVKYNLNIPAYKIERIIKLYFQYIKENVANLTPVKIPKFGKLIIRRGKLERYLYSEMMKERGFSQSTIDTLIQTKVYIKQRNEIKEYGQVFLNRQKQ
jgi:hypothetical protein